MLRRRSSFPGSRDERHQGKVDIADVLAAQIDAELADRSRTAATPMSPTVPPTWTTATSASPPLATSSDLVGDVRMTCIGAAAGAAAPLRPTLS
jgi:hypothetical protein